MKSGQDYVNTIRKEVVRDAKFGSHHKPHLEKLFFVIKELKDENIRLSKGNEELKRELKAEREKRKVEKATQEKDSKFMSEQLKRIGNDKLKLEKRISELEKGKKDNFPKRVTYV